MSDSFWLRVENALRGLFGYSPRDPELERLDRELAMLESWMGSAKDRLAILIASQGRLKTELEVRSHDLQRLEKDLEVVRQTEDQDEAVVEELSERWGRLSWIVEEAIRLLKEHQGMQAKLLRTVLRGEVKEADLKGRRSLHLARKDLEAGRDLAPERWGELHALRHRLEELTETWSGRVEELQQEPEADEHRATLAAAREEFDREYEALQELASTSASE